MQPHHGFISVCAYAATDHIPVALTENVETLSAISAVCNKINSLHYGRGPLTQNYYAESLAGNDNVLQVLVQSSSVPSSSMCVYLFIFNGSVVICMQPDIEFELPTCFISVLESSWLC